MSRNRFGRITAFALVIAVSASLFLTVHGVVYQTVLAPGDSAGFSVKGPFSENVTKTELLVLSVIGTRLTANFTDTYLDGSQAADTFYLDIATGERNSTVPGASLIFAVGTNLSPGDRLNGNDPYVVDRQETLDCGGQRRDTVVSSYSSGGLSILSNWDRSTGLLCLFIEDDPTTSDPVDLRLAMTETSLWGAESVFLSDVLSVGPFLVVAAIVLVGLFLFYRSRRSRRKSV